MSARLRVTVAIYTASLRLCPRSFVVAHGDDLRRTFEEAARVALARRGPIGLVALLLAEVADLATAAGRLGRSARAPRIGARAGGRFPMRLLSAIDLRRPLTALRARPAYTALCIALLALGIGLNAAIFSILDSVLIRPMPFHDAARFVTIANYNLERRFTYQGASRAFVLEWRKQTDVFDRVEAYESLSLVYQGERGDEMVSGTLVTPGLLPMLGVQPRLGRLFTNADGRGGSDRIAIVSARFWYSHLAGDPHPIGQTLTLDGTRYQIVGVMPASFRFPDELHDVWLPWNADAPPPAGTGPERQSVSPTLVPFARLRPGLTVDEVQPQLQTRGAGINRASGGTGPATAMAMRPWQLVDDTTQTSLMVLAAAVGFLLLMVSANLANLALSNALPRARDYAVRSALGASRWRLIWEIAVENLLVGLVGCAAGLGVAAASIRVALAVMPDEMTSRSFSAVMLDWRVAGVAAVLGVAASLLFALPPAIVASRTSVVEVLGRESRSTTGSRFSRRLRAGLVIVEVSLSIVLLVGAALMARSFFKLQHLDKGLDPDGLIALRLGLPASGYADVHVQDRFVMDVVDRLRRLPGVTAATTGGVPPEVNAVLFGEARIAGQPEERSGQLVLPLYTVPADFFSTLGIRILEGRTFEPGDPAGAVIVSEAFARKFWATDQAVGGRFRLSDDADWMTIVGVAGSVRSSGVDQFSGGMQVYQPFGGASQAMAAPVRPASTMAAIRTVVVRATDPVAAAALLPQAVHDVDPRVVIWKRDFVAQLFADALARPRILFAMLAVFAGFGLVLAAAGLYGVLSCLVAQRLREIGVRLALGARPGDVGRVIFRSGVGLTLIGAAVGVTASLGVMRAMRSLLYDVAPTDPLSVVAVVALLVIVALAASWRPARRAMRVDPLTLLREQ